MTIFFDCCFYILIFSLLALRVWFHPQVQLERKHICVSSKAEEKRGICWSFFLNCWTIKNAKKVIFMFQDLLVTQGCEDEKEFSYVKEL